MSFLRRLAPHADIFTATHAPLAWVRASDGALLPLSALQAESAVAFSGIADGSAFVETVSVLGVQVESARDFGDHHAYSAGEIKSLARSAKGRIAITTEKDHASFSLPFCAPGYFGTLWEQILASLVPGGRLSGQLFGDRDGWAGRPGMTHHTRAEAETLLASLVLERFDE